jgi:Flp pilus assembly protein TadD
VKAKNSPRHTALIQQGIALHKQRRFVEAERCYQTVLRENLQHPDALNLMGVLAIEAGRNDIAIDYMRKALAIGPNEPMYLNNLGNALIINSQYDEAIQLLRKAVKLDPRHAEALTNLGKAQRMVGDVERAAKSFQRALAAMPGYLLARAGLAEIASEAGRFAEAESAFSDILATDPENIEALCGIAAVKKYEAADPLFTRIERVLLKSTLRDDQRAPLHHAVAKICNDSGRYDDAVAHYAKGKEYKRLLFHLELHRASYSAQKEMFTRQFFAERVGFGLVDERPLFVVGMPRSGTTLTEQVLSSHQSIQGLGELPDMRHIAGRLGSGSQDPQKYSRAVAALTGGDCANLANTYLSAFGRANPSSLRLIDKSPHNYEHLGLIALLFPKAHIIHCRRDPMDNCVAIYMQNFSEGHGYNKDFQTLGAYYREYQGLMDHWSKVLPLPVHENVYEQTVFGFESSARAMVGFLGLPWDDNCLRYFESERQVRTPSRWQVRQPIYSSSVDRWKRYEKYLGPLKAALGIVD